MTLKLNFHVFYWCPEVWIAGELGSLSRFSQCILGGLLECNEKKPKNIIITHFSVYILIIYLQYDLDPNLHMNVH